MKESYLYQDYVGTLSRRFAGEIDTIAAEHNFEFGPEFEIALASVLRNILPDKYGVCRGYVVNAQGESAGDDIIIYDRAAFPTLLLRGRDADRKEHVPAEAVYAYIEAKHTLQIDGDGGGSLSKAISQVEAVRRVCDSRYRLNNAAPGPLPKPFLMIFSRYVSKGRDRLTDPKEIIGLLPETTLPGPDAIIAGNDVATRIASKYRFSNGKDGFIYQGGMYQDLNSKLVPHVLDNRAFGLAAVYLMAAMQNVQLGSLPWLQIVNNTMDRGSQPAKDFVNDITNVIESIYGRQ